MIDRADYSVNSSSVSVMFGIRLPERRPAPSLILPEKERIMLCHCNDHPSDLSLLKPVLAEYADIKGSLITILQQAQEIYGYLPTDVIYHIAERTGLTPARVLGTATFYTQFRFQPVGKYLIMLCDGTACHVNGSSRIAAAVQEYLHVENGGTTEDGLFSFSIVACLGCCSLSPVMMINEETYGSLTPAKVLDILKEIRAKEAAK